MDPFETIRCKIRREVMFTLFSPETYFLLFLISNSHLILSRKLSMPTKCELKKGPFSLKNIISQILAPSPPIIAKTLLMMTCPIIYLLFFFFHLQVRFKKRCLTTSRPRVNFINVLCAAFTPLDPEIVKSTLKSSVSFCTFEICARKICM